MSFANGSFNSHEKATPSASDQGERGESCQLSRDLPGKVPEAAKKLILEPLADSHHMTCHVQVIKESAARAASSVETSPSKAPEAAGGDRSALVKELADVKKRFLAVAKKKQADFAKRV